MKILFLFTDMVRANLLKTYNSEIRKDKPLDYFSKKMGGTVYLNCYSPAPDTPRSLACFHSGQYSNKNGCDNRLKWPLFYYKSQESLFKTLAENNFEVCYYATKHKLKVGSIPKTDNDFVNPYDDANIFIEQMKCKLKKNADSVFFITLDDYHWSNEDIGHNLKADFVGQKHILDYFDSFFKIIEMDNFDYIFWFSDHGHKLDHEITKNRSIENLLDDNRTKIVMQVRRKHGSRIVFDTNLRSIMDVYPTFLDILNLKRSSDIDGKSLFSNDCHEYLFFEDHAKFDVSLGQVLENWAVRTKEHFYFENLETSLSFKVKGLNKYESEKLNQQDVENYRLIFRKHSSSYEEMKKQYSILQFYQRLKEEKQCFLDGEKRCNNMVTKFTNFLCKILRVL